MSTIATVTGQYGAGERTLGIIAGIVSALAVLAVIAGAFWVVGGTAGFRFTKLVTG